MELFDPTIQYRNTIIRGKAKSDLDNLLPKYAAIIQEICPCSKDVFGELFNEKLKGIVGDLKKTLDNHRTEIAGKLFGMYFMGVDEYIYASERTLNLLENQDQPQFFKDICIKFQFPNGMDSIPTNLDKINNKIKLRQFPYILELLNMAELEGINLTKNEIGYFVLNSLEVLQGKVRPKAVLDLIIQYRNNGIVARVSHEGKASSFSMQHINEQINLLELANLIRVKDHLLYLNPYEKNAIDYIRSLWNSELGFDSYLYSLDTIENRKTYYFDWQFYYSTIDKDGLNITSTSVNAIQYSVDKKYVQPKEHTGIDKIKLGDDGELFVYNYEINRVKKYDCRLINKVLLLGKTRGLGYDIQSIIADGGDKSEYVQYIEVKSTKRTTMPMEGQDGWLDAVSLTRNEWIAAEQHSDSYALFRVYFTIEKTVVYVINNPFKKNTEGKIKCLPINYRLDFSINSIDHKFENNEKN